MGPIICRINESNDQSPFVSGVYIGASKPSSLQDFLLPFVLDYLACVKQVFKTANGIACLVRILNVICDAPARSFVKGTKLYSGYNACDYCDQVGVYDRALKKIVYSSISGEPRSDESFASFGETGHQMIETPMTQIVPMVTSFPPDPMHAVFLGVIRRLILVWVDERYGSHRFPPSVTKELSSKIVEFGKQLPEEFKRKSRPLSDIKNWKAVEFRNFLLYIGPIVLKNVLSKEKYEHFLLLHFAIYSLSSDDWKVHISSTRVCLEQFVCLVKQIYGDKELTYNTHLLLHLPDFVEKFGQLDFWSAFWAESFLGVLRRRFRGRSNLLSQAVNRINEVHAIYSATSGHSSQPSRKKKNTYLTSKGVVQAETISGNKCTGMLLLKTSNLYAFPRDSGVHNIGYYFSTEQCVSAEILKKCCVFDVEEGQIVVPFSSSRYFGH